MIMPINVFLFINIVLRNHNMDINRIARYGRVLIKEVC